MNWFQRIALESVPFNLSGRCRDGHILEKWRHKQGYLSMCIGLSEISNQEMIELSKYRKAEHSIK